MICDPPTQITIHRLRATGLDEESRSRVVFFYAFVRFAFSLFSGSHISQCGLLEALLLFTTSWSA